MKLTFFLFLIAIINSKAQRSDFSAVTFNKADSIAKIYRGESLENLPVLTHNLTSSLTTDVEKFRAIYTWVSTNIKNDYSSYLKTRQKRKKYVDDRVALLEWNTNFTPKVFENLLKYKKTACTGYAYLIKELANLANIECEIIGGFGRTATINLENNSLPNHSWNAVNIDNKWYLCDATWSAGKIEFEDETPVFKSDYMDGYFLADPELFIKNHYPIEADWTLVKNPLTFNQFIKGPLVYKYAFKANIIPANPSKMYFESKKGETVLFELTAEKLRKKDTMTLLLNTGSGAKKITPIVTKQQNNCQLEYTFEKSGTYDVHIQVNGLIIATYVVKVKRK